MLSHGVDNGIDKRRERWINCHQILIELKLMSSCISSVCIDKSEFGETELLFKQYHGVGKGKHNTMGKQYFFELIL